MKLDVWSKPSKYMSERGYEYEDAGLIETHRFIYLFFDQNALDNHESKNIINGQRIYGKAIQINLSVSHGGSDNIDLPPWIRGTDNSTYITCGMYIYDTIFETDITNIYSARFILNESLISSTTNDYNIKKAMLNGTNIYSKDIRDKPEKKAIISASIYEFAPSVPDPMYYTVRHQEAVEDDMYCLTSIDTVVEHEGKDLYDTDTRVSVMNMSLISTLEPKMKQRIYDLQSQINKSDRRIKMYNSVDLSDELLYQDFESMQNGFTYIYDTNAGTNIVKTSKSFMPFAKYQFNDKLQYDLERTLIAIKNHAKCIEKEFGPVRIHFTPLYFGDKADVYFKDWKPENQPIIANKYDVDNGFKVQNNINTQLVDCNEDYEE